MNQIWKEKIETDVQSNKVVVYMRGTPNQPRCGFSARVIRVFNELNIPFKSEDMDSIPNCGRHFRL